MIFVCIAIPLAQHCSINGDRGQEAIATYNAAYNVSGEFSMVKAAAECGWIDEKAIVMESLTAMTCVRKNDVALSSLV